jgi:hypothetical protein
MQKLLKLADFVNDTAWEFYGELLDSPGYMISYIIVGLIELIASTATLSASDFPVRIFVSWLPLVLFGNVMVLAHNRNHRGNLRLSIAAVFVMAFWGASVIPFQEVHVWHALGAFMVGVLFWYNYIVARPSDWFEARADEARDREAQAEFNQRYSIQGD